MDLEDGILPLWGLILSGLGMTVMTILAIVGNILVIISYFRDKGLQTVHNVYIVNLAVADLFVGGISMLFYVHFTLRNKVWVFGRAMCKVWCFNDYSVCLQTVMLMLLLSLDRVVLLRTGARYIATQTRKKAAVKCAISWSIALGIYGPAVILWDIVRGFSVVDENDCEAEFVSNVKFGIVAAVCELVIPCVALTILNAMVFIAIRKRLKIFSDRSSIRMVSSQQPKPSVFSIMSIANAIPKEAHDNLDQTEKEKTPRNKHSSNRKDIKAAKSLAVLVAAFVLCWGPYTICTLVASVCEDCVNIHLYEFVTWLLWAKSAINPLLYASQSTQFKVNFMRLLPFLKLCPKR